LWNLPIKDPGVPACAVGATASTAVAAAPAKAVPAQAIRCVIDTGHSPFHGRFPPGTGANRPESRRMTSRAHQSDRPRAPCPYLPCPRTRGESGSTLRRRSSAARRTPGQGPVCGLVRAVPGKHGRRAGPNPGQDGMRARTEAGVMTPSARCPARRSSAGRGRRCRRPGARRRRSRPGRALGSPVPPGPLAGARTPAPRPTPGAAP